MGLQMQWETVVCNKNYSEDDFYANRVEIALNNQDRKDLEDYALYGAFHEWKGQATNFHDKATSILSSEKLSFSEQAETYTHLVLSTAKLWMVFSSGMETVTPAEAVGVANKYVSRELSKIAHRLTKNS